MRDRRWRKYWASTAEGVLLPTQFALWIAWGGGDACRDYMTRVPGWNPLVGISRWFRRKAS